MTRSSRRAALTVQALGGEPVKDENGNPVYTGSTPFTFKAGQGLIRNRGEQVYYLEQGDGSLTPIGASSFAADRHARARNAFAGASVSCLPGDLPGRRPDLDRRLRRLDDLPARPDQWTRTGNTVTLASTVATTCTYTGCVLKVAFVIQRPVQQTATDQRVYDGSEAVVDGQPILGRLVLQFDANNHVLVYGSTNDKHNVREAYYWIPTAPARCRSRSTSCPRRRTTCSRS